MNRLAWEETSLPKVKTSFLQLPLPELTLGARMYHGSRERPLIIYFHGGGWTIGDLDTHHPFCLHLAAQTRCTVMSVDYRLAPEHPFPAALQDAVAALAYAWQHAPGGRRSPARAVFVCGDSAGGGLALALHAALGSGEAAPGVSLSAQPPPPTAIAW